MRKQTIYQLNSLYRDNMKVTGYFYGKGEPALCIMGALRGDEIQQLYICSQLNKRLKQMEREGRICPGKEMTVRLKEKGPRLKMERNPCYSCCESIFYQRGKEILAVR